MRARPMEPGASARHGGWRSRCAGQIATRHPSASCRRPSARPRNPGFGVLAILGAYAASQFGLVNTSKICYEVRRELPGLRHPGGGSGVNRQPGFILLEGAWALASLRGTQQFSGVAARHPVPIRARLWLPRVLGGRELRSRGGPEKRRCEAKVVEGG
jgi:hypothetical protein